LELRGRRADRRRAARGARRALAGPTDRRAIAPAPRSGQPMTDEGAATGRQLVLATYNVHRFCGTDGVCDPTRVAGVVEEMRPDVIAVQEADLPRHQPIDASTFVRCLPGYECVAAPGRRVGGRWFGNLVLSRLPILSAERVDLSHARREPRSALDVVIDLGGAELRVVAAHLGLVHRERRGQVDRLLARI